jgi:hypothetical protein
MPELHRIADNRYAAVRLRFPFARILPNSTLCGQSLHIIQWQQLIVIGHNYLSPMIYGNGNHMLIKNLRRRREHAGRYALNHLISCCVTKGT